MEKQKLEQIAGQFEQLTDNQGSEFLSRFAKILSLLAEGRPVPLKEVAENLRISPAKAKVLLTKYGGEFDTEGNLIGLGLTQVPTPHMFEVSGHKLYAWCAADTLLFPMILGRTARVKTSDPVSQAEISLTITPRGVQEIEPAGAVLSWSTHVGGDVRTSFCNFTHWFASRENARKYTARHRGVTILTADQVSGIFKIMLERAEIPI
jgi:alkylmercury lyase